MDAAAAAAASPAAASAAAAPAVPPPPEAGAATTASRKLVFISFTALQRDYLAQRIPPGVLESPDTLFFFGSKRFWLFPASTEQAREGLAQGPHYAAAPAPLRALVLDKEAQGRACFLKPDVLGEPDVEVFGDYARAGAWLAAATGGAAALRLEPAWWRGVWDARRGRFCSSGEAVAQNLQAGLHSYGPVCEMLWEAGCDPVLDWGSRR